ncbi:MAG: hypothetical protein AB7O37_02270 [Vicinamibacteria bacterium]
MAEPKPAVPVAGIVAGLFVIGIAVALLFWLQPRAQAPTPPPVSQPAVPAATPAAPVESGAAQEPAAEAPGAPAADAAGPSTGRPPQARAAAGAAGAPPAPRGQRGTAGLAPPLTAQAMMRRAFVPSRSSDESVRGVSKDLSGFDSTAAREVQVKRASEIPGRIEFSMEPLRVKPGDKYAVRIALVNEGKKAIEVEELELVTTVNGKPSREKVKPLVKQVASRQNEVVYELAGAWDKGTRSWALAVSVMSEKKDLYRNQLTWK